VLLIQIVREADARTQSKNNLKEIGIAINGYALSNKGQLPNAGTQAGTTSAPFNGSSYWFCGGFPAGANEAGSPYTGPAPGPTFIGGILSQMKGNTKCLLDPLDPSVIFAPPGTACSYSIPAYWGTLSNGTGNLLMPASFPRGVGQSIGVAEMCTNNVDFNKINAFGPVGKEIYTTSDVLLANLKAFPAANNGSAAPGTGTIGNPATAFSLSGLQVVLMDGSVKTITPNNNTATGFSDDCHPNDCDSGLDPNW
jgi:hypothetical protein